MNVWLIGNNIENHLRPISFAFRSIKSDFSGAGDLLKSNLGSFRPLGSNSPILIFISLIRALRLVTLSSKPYVKSSSFSRRNKYSVPIFW